MAPTIFGVACQAELLASCEAADARLGAADAAVLVVGADRVISCSAALGS
jgi:hypothetical protein